MCLFYSCVRKGRPNRFSKVADGLPSKTLAVVMRPKNRVLRVEPGDGSRIVTVDCRIMFHSQHTNLLFYFWIDRVLGEGWNGKADCQTY